MPTVPFTHTESGAEAIFREALAACSVDAALARKLRVVGDEEAGIAAALPMRPSEAVLDLRGVSRLLVLAMGKGATAMLQAVLARADMVHGRTVKGILVAPVAPAALPPDFRFFAGGHPLPNQASFDAAQAMLAMLRDEPASPHTCVLFLVSGGASAMVETPLDARIALDDMVALYRALVHSGATIREVNCVRKHVSAVKGGRLAVAAAHLRSLSLLVSDVPADYLDALASGPTLPDSTTVADCREVLARYGLAESLPQNVSRLLLNEGLPETPKPGTFASEHVVLLASEDLADAASAAARARGYCVVVDNICDDWPEDRAAAYLLARFRELRAAGGRVCLISTGEVTVRVPAAYAGAAGGRNGHFVLRCGTLLTPQDAGMAVLSCGSDGVDGSSLAAGAVLSAEVCAGQAWLERAEAALAAFDSDSFLSAMGRLVVTGPTGTNLRDLRLLLA